MSSWFFLDPSAFSKQEIGLAGEVLRHLKALRLEAGDEIVLSDGRGSAYRARLENFSAREARAVLLGELHTVTESPLPITLYPAVVKGEKMDQLVRQAVELGVCRIVPVLTGRTVVRLGKERAEKKSGRWQNIARAAASQCRRSMLPEVLPPLELDELPEVLKEDELVIVPWEEEHAGSLANLREEFPSPGSVGIVTGPEGGMSPEEIGILKALPHVHLVNLGPRILRAETAPLVVLSVAQYIWGDVGSMKGEPDEKRG